MYLSPYKGKLIFTRILWVNPNSHKLNMKMSSKIENVEGILAYLDIAGFSNYLQTSDFSKEFESFYKILDDTIKKYDEESVITFRFFSDSIIIYSKKVTKKVLINMIKTISRINFKFINELNLVLCGSISVGKFKVYKKEGNILIAGSPIVEAVRYEQIMNCFGITISPSLISSTKYFNNLIDRPLNSKFWDTVKKGISDKTLHYFVHNVKIPIKSQENPTETTEGLLTIPIDDIDPLSKSNIGVSFLKTTFALSRLKYSAFDPIIQEKYRKSTNLYNEIQERIMKIEEDL